VCTFIFELFFNHQDFIDENNLSLIIKSFINLNSLQVSQELLIIPRKILIPFLKFIDGETVSHLLLTLYQNLFDFSSLTHFFHECFLHHPEIMSTFFLENLFEFTFEKLSSYDEESLFFSIQNLFDFYSCQISDVGFNLFVETLISISEKVIFYFLTKHYF
jgi:hypothetical protein